MSLRAAVVGTSFGARIHVPALRQAGFEVVAIVGQDPARTARRAERLGIPNACTSLPDALALGLDAVSIAGPPATHGPLAAQAIAAGVHVLCEKPFTTTTDEARRLVDGAEETSLVGLLGHEFRWSPAQSAIAWALGEGAIGSPRLAVSISFISMLREFSMPSWWFDDTAGGGWLRASGSHRVDALRQWFGEVEALSAGQPTLSDPPLGIDDTFSVRLRMRSGVDVSLVQSAAALGPTSSVTRVVGTKGTLWADGDEVFLADLDSFGGRPVTPPAHLALPDVTALATGALAAMTRMELPPYIMLTRAFARAIAGEPVAPGPRPATFADGLACMEVLDAVRRSAADRGSWTTVKGGERDGPG